MIVSRDRRSFSPILEISISSMTILPPADSRIRNKARVRLDLPAPVRPTIPILREKNEISLEQGESEAGLACSSTTDGIDLEREGKWI